MELTIEQTLHQGVAAHKEGKLQDAERLYCAILQSQPSHPDANHNLGVLAVSVNKAEAALPFFKTALEVNPSQAQFWLSYIEALIKLDRLVEAKAVLDQAKDKGAKGEGFDKLEASINRTNEDNPSSDATQLLHQAIVHREAGEFVTAIKILTDGLNKFPSDAEYLSLLAHCYLSKDDIENASFYLDKAKLIDPHNATVGWNVVRLLLKKKNVADALSVAKSTNERFPADIEGMGVLGSSLRANNEIEESLLYLEKAISLNPNYVEALINRGLIKLTQEDRLGALSDLEAAHKLKPHIKQIWDLLISLKIGFEQFEEVILFLINMIEIDPNNEKNFELLTECNSKLGNVSLTITSFKKVLEIKPNDVAALLNIGIALKSQGDLEAARDSFKKAIKIKPDFAEPYYYLGNALKEQGALEEAIEAFNKALLLKPDYADAYNNMGISFQEQGALEEAIEAYNKSLSLKPDSAEAYNNMGITLQDQGKLEEAIEAYNKALSIKPDYAEAYNNMGNALKEQGKLEKAIEAYNKALSIKPDDVNTYNNMGISLQEQGALEEAIEAYNKALLLKPDNAKTYNNMGNALNAQGKLDEAIKAYKQAIKIKPDFELARTSKLHNQARICDWVGIEEDRHLMPELGILTQHLNPFSLLSLEDVPDRHCLRSEIYAEKRFKNRKLTLPSTSLSAPDRLRVGYVSNDFREHPLSYLLARTLELHNRDSFEIYAYSVGPEGSGKMRARIRNAVDFFIDIRKMSDHDAVKLIQKDKIDILIDLVGYTKGHRTGIFQYRPSPIQINYMGYPGTMGANFIDYLIADQNLIPDEMQQYYKEKIIYLPNCYQPNDNTRVISDNAPTKSELGLPEKSFVFCCFNDSYKITSAEFNIWMRLLGKVNKSVLWLLSSNKWAEENLKDAATIRGISSDRIIFAPKLPQADHLARLNLADLFLDTFIYNAGATATDALWSRLPMITKVGQGYAARMAGSILSSIGLSELITTTEEQYEELALRLATTQGELIAIRKKLAANRLTSPLFNSELSTRHLENGYRQAYQLHFERKSPNHIYVPT